MKDRLALGLAAMTLALHAVFANRYDVFRDELYFIVCGRHPAFGYVDQPPLVPLLAAAFYGLGHQVWLLRLPPILAAATTVWLAVRFARLLGGGNAAAWVAGIAAGIAPELLGLAATFNTTVFEPLGWTAVAYALARMVVLDDRRAPLWGGLVAGLALEAKYALVVWVVALALGLLATPQRSVFARRELALGAAIGIIVALPSIVWQAAHGWPFAELVRAAGPKNAATPIVAFVLNQVFVMNVFLAPVWIAGVLAPFFLRELARVRFLALAFVVAALLTILGHGKDYYLAAAYPTVFAIGAVAWERLVPFLAMRIVFALGVCAYSALVAPFALPVLAPGAILGYEQALGVKPQAQEKNQSGDQLPQLFADQLGWHDFVREVGTAYDTLSPDVRARTSILVTNYGEAAALDIYGGAYALPPALSGHNNYYLWGLRGQHPRNVLVVRDDVAVLKDRCQTVRVLGTTGSPYAMAYENGRTIAFCGNRRPALSTVWADFKRYN